MPFNTCHSFASFVLAGGVEGMMRLRVLARPHAGRRYFLREGAKG